MSRKSWTAGEDDLLKLLWATEPDRKVVLAGFPGRSYGSLVCRASNLGIRRPLDHKQRGDPVIEGLPVEFVSWLAGFIDGEGTIGIYKRGNTVDALISIANTSFPALKHIYDTLRCGYITRKSGKGDREYQGYYYRVCQRRKLASLVERLIPHLVVKKENAEILLQFLNEELAGTLDPTKTAKYLQAFRVLNMRGDDAILTDPYSKDFDEYRRNR